MIKISILLFALLGFSQVNATFYMPTPVGSHSMMFDFTGNTANTELLPMGIRTIIGLQLMIDTTVRASVYCCTGSGATGCTKLEDNMGLQGQLNRDIIYYCSGSVNSVVTNYGGFGGNTIITWVDRDITTENHSMDVRIVPPTKADFTELLSSPFSQGTLSIIALIIGLWIFWTLLILALKKGWEHGKKISIVDDDDNTTSK